MVNETGGESTVFSEREKKWGDSTGGRVGKYKEKAAERLPFDFLTGENSFDR